MEQPGRYDAIVVGAGPSGSSCAALLAAKGCRVLLLDKAHFPRDKTCGDAIGGKALNVLRELGLDGQLAEKGFLRNSGVVFSSPAGDEVEIPLLQDGEKMSGGFVCKREDYDGLLFKNAKEKCDALEDTEVVDLVFEGDRVAGVKAKSKSGNESLFYGKLVIGADGASSVVARRTMCAKLYPAHMCSAIRGYYSGIKALRGNIEIHFLPECMPGYFWIFPLSKTQANVGVGMLLSDISKKKLNLWKVLDGCLKNPKMAGRFYSARLDGELKGWSLPLASAKRKCAGNGFILLGDAASLVDPFSGEGVGNGMKSAKIASDVLGKALAEREVSLNDCLAYEKALWEEIGPDVQTSYRMQKLGAHSALLNFIIGKAMRSRWLQHELAGMIASREAKKKAASLLFYIRVLFS